MNLSLPTDCLDRPFVLVCHQRPSDWYRAGRTFRALHERGISVDRIRSGTWQEWAPALQEATGPVWLLRAGTWPVWLDPVRFPLPSITGRPLCALGCLRAPAGSSGAIRDEAKRWSALLAKTGGDLTAACLEDLEGSPSIYLDGELARQLGRAASLQHGWQGILRNNRCRLVHCAALDVYDDLARRVVQFITSLQQGGAERVVLDLVQELPACGVRSLVITLGQPTRTPFPRLPPTIDLAARVPNFDKRAAAAARLAIHWGADLIHCHLIDAASSRELAARGLPVLHTVHNMRPGWPDGLAELRPGEAALLVACARAVEEELRTAKLDLPIRTVWNAIDFAAFAETPELLSKASAVRQALNLQPGDFVLLALANPRPQKRLHLLPAIVAATQQALAERGLARPVRLILAGEASPTNPKATAAVDLVRAEIARLKLEQAVRWTGAVTDVAPLLAAADVLVATSAYEGLSLAQLEALAAGKAVVATAASGTAELAGVSPAVTVLPLDAPPARFADALASIAQRAPVVDRLPVRVHFDRQRMAEQYARLYPRAIVAAGLRQGSGLWLITNNFSTGGAQSSARRLLVALHQQGIPVRAAVLQEEPDYPTPGRRRLTAAGIPVVALPPAGTTDAAAAVALLLEHIDGDPPQAILFWNALAEYKLLLADGLLDIPLYDISPGEMYFASLERYFARPRPGLPYQSPADYGTRLAGVIVKYQAEAARAAELLQTEVHVIPNGVPLDLPPLGHKPPGPLLVLGTLARISPQKKLEQLLGALRRASPQLPPHILRIAGGVEAGSEEYFDGLRRQAEGLAVEWLGEQEDTDRFLRELDFFVMVSEPAGCPNASLEAMAAGLAVIATDVGGAGEQVHDGVHGRLVPRGDEAALAEAIVELANQPNRRHAWGLAARAHVERHFSLHRMVADYRRVCLR